MAKQATRQGALQRLTGGPEQPWLRVRYQLARLGAVRPCSAVLDSLFKITKASHPKANLLLIEHAYHTAEQSYRGQKRKSGNPYIIHPLAVTTIFVELGMTEPVLVAALLHNIVEGIEYILEQLHEEFTDEMARMIDGITKLGKVTYGETVKTGTIRGTIMATSEEVRVPMIKFADRLHNIRTIGFLRLDKQVRIATGTFSIFVSLAHRLGTNTAKWELGDPSFQIIGPKVHSEIASLMARQTPEREHHLRDLIAQFKQLTAGNKIKTTIYGYPKHFYLVYRKMTVRGRDLADIYGLIGLQVLVDNIRDCYGVFGVTRSKRKPIPGRFRDRTANPRFSAYQSLHTAVLGDRGGPIELRIHAHEIHRWAEYGTAAYWKCKENLHSGVAPEEARLRTMYQLGVMSEEAEDPTGFPDSVLSGISSDEIYMFTLKGEVNALPVEATPVDFAFSVHMEVGYRYIGAQVSDRLVALSTKLIQGSKVEILTSKSPNTGPSRDWFGFITTSRARQKIKQYSLRERRDEAIEGGEEMLARQLRRTGLPMQRPLTLEDLTAVANELCHAGVPNLYKAIQEGQIGARSVVTHLMGLVGGEGEAVDTITEDEGVWSSRRRPRAATESRVPVDSDPTMAAKLVRCCYPIPDDKIVGFVTCTDGISVHRVDCTNVPTLRRTPERLVKVTWNKAEGGQFPVTIQVEGIDRSGLLIDINRVISDLYVGILEATLILDRDKKFSGRLTFESPDPGHLDHVLKQVCRVPGVYDTFHMNS